MNCRDALDLMHAYVDGELDLLKAVEIEQHLGFCPACKVQYDRLRELSSSVRANAAYHAAPQAARARFAAALPRDHACTLRPTPRGWIGMAAALAFAVLVGLGLGLSLFRPGAEDRLAQEVIAGHVRSLMANHLTDIASSDQHTVKPWIAGKLDFSPPVTDFAAQGYVLSGGRLDYLAERGVMALVYRRHAHLINTFIWPALAAGDSPLRLDSRQGYNLAHFTRGGMAYWAVSDLNTQELKIFAGLLQGQANGN